MDYLFKTNIIVFTKGIKALRLNGVKAKQIVLSINMLWIKWNGRANRKWCELQNVC